MVANTITQGRSSGNHTNKQLNPTPNGGNCDNHVHVGEIFLTVILWYHVPFANSPSATVDRLWASLYTMDVPSRTVFEDIEALRTATRTTWGLHGKSLQHGGGNWILHKYMQNCSVTARRVCDDTKEPCMNEELLEGKGRRCVLTTYLQH